MTAMCREINAIVDECRLRLLSTHNSKLNDYYALQACRGNKYEVEMGNTSQTEQKTKIQQSNDVSDATVFVEVGCPQTTPASADFLVCYATAHG